MNAETARANAARLRVIERLSCRLVDLGYDVDIREDYSGRGMYGATVPAIFVSGNVSENDLGRAGRLLRRDSMGRGVVLY